MPAGMSKLTKSSSSVLDLTKSLHVTNAANLTAFSDGAFSYSFQWQEVEPADLVKIVAKISNPKSLYLVWL